MYYVGKTNKHTNHNIKKPNPSPQTHVYQTDPNWLPNPSPDRSKDYVQECVDEDDSQVKKLWRLPERAIMNMLKRESCYGEILLERVRETCQRKGEMCERGKRENNKR